MKRERLMARLAWLWAVAVGTALAPQMARAVDGQVEVAGGGVIEYTGAAKVEKFTNETGGQGLLLYYTYENSTNDTSEATFTFPGTTSAKILAVGGGGGGGGGNMMAYDPSHGGGGGGGGGQVREDSGLYPGATYSVSVGAGGAGGLFSYGVDYSGQNGDETVILTNGVKMVTAIGGGGGGGESPGKPGASGGGGSYLNGTLNGGAGSFGGTGGNGDKGYLGGGGGGAGGDGANGSANGGGVGGIGLQHDITLDYGTDKASWPYYAGGGGGGNIDMTATSPASGIPGGKGGGGHGGVGGYFVAPGNGDPATGGGGGGGNYGLNGGNGGSGVVYVRISKAMVGPLERPKTPLTVTYDRNAHTSVVDTAFYYLKEDSENIATDARETPYKATVILRENVTWPDGGQEPVEVLMTIKPVEVKLSNLHIDDWVYGAGNLGHSEKIPDPTCDVEPKWMQLKFEYAESKESETWTFEKPIHAGDHWLRVTRPESPNYVGETVDYYKFTIKKREVSYQNLALVSWMAGTPAEETPKPTCTITPPWAATVYEYATNKTAVAADWREQQPTEVGHYYVRARVENTDDYVQTTQDVIAEFDILKGLGRYFTDYVEITIAPYAGGGDLVSFPFKIVLHEAKNAPLHGFLYSRAGEDGESMAFTDADGNLLDYQVSGKWNKRGDSVVYVKVPRVSASKPTTIRLFWHCRLGVLPPDHHADRVWREWKREEQAAIAAPAYEYSLVVRDGRRCNYWTKLPHMTKTEWNVGEESGRIDVRPVLKEGDWVWQVIKFKDISIPTPANPEDLALTEGGCYRVGFMPDDPMGVLYEPLECHVDVSITGRYPIPDLTGILEGATVNDRILLGNDDDTPGHQVIGQAYWRTADVTNDCFWVHSAETHGAPPAGYPNFKPGVHHMLQTVDTVGQTNTLWRLRDVIFGNTHSASATFFSSKYCYLPWSGHSLGNALDAPGPIANCTGSGNLVLRNKEGATIYSPFYTNGIGTIYFDAVNQNTTDAPNGYKLVIEVATKTLEGKMPTDANSYDPANADALNLAKIGEENWQPVAMIPLKRDNGETFFREEEATKELALGVTFDQSTNNFYRVYATVDCRQPSRFRIRRVSKPSDFGLDRGGFILVDNLIVSYPKMQGEVDTCGVYDPNRGGRHVIGWGGAMATPFPAVGDREVKGMGKAVTYVSGLTNVTEDSLITMARFHYRWRYLDQTNTDWKVVTLTPANGFRSEDSLDLPDLEGDVEYWYESFTQVPFYTYVDYSGLNVGLKKPDGSLFYTEEQTTVTNRLKEAKWLPSGGTDWFFRLRNGRSEVEGVRLVTRDWNGTIATNDMDLVGDSVWRGYFETPTNAAGKAVDFRFEYYNRQPKEGSTDYAVNTNYFKYGADGLKLPGSGGLVATSGTNEWSTLEIDALTGAVMFMVDDSVNSLTALHCDRQDFNRWTDAMRPEDEGRFVGQYELGGKDPSGTGAATHTYDDEFGRWQPSAETKSNLWYEAFNDDPAQYAIGVEFGNANTPNGWQSGPGQWVYGCYSDKDTGLALQLRGQGQGSLQFVNGPESPRGLRSISFAARLAQTIELGDFAFYDCGQKAKFKDYTFTAKGAFDLNERHDFSGAASLSLVGYLMPNQSCYEFRVSQKDATGVMSGKKKTVTGAGKKKLFQLFRWRYDEAADEMAVTQLGADFEIEVDTMLKTKGTDGGDDLYKASFSTLFISCAEETVGGKLATVIKAGVSREGKNPNDASAGPSAWLVFVDSDEKRLTGGTFGVGSANCPARFCDMLWYSRPLTQWKSNTSSSPENIPLPTDGKAKTDASRVPAWPEGLEKPCFQDIAGREWTYVPGRMEAAMGDFISPLAGLRAVAQPQEIAVYTAKAGTIDWGAKPVTNIFVSSFGRDGANGMETFDLYTLDECSVKLQMGGSVLKARRDVIIQAVELRQWRGESYTDVEYYDDRQIRQGAPSNFVFTTAWIEPDGVVRLSARRTSPDRPASIRTPFMDGVSGRGSGLGMVSFAYQNAHSNLNLLVQIATNLQDTTDLALATTTAEGAYWTTVTNFDFAAMSDAERAEGVKSCYFGQHGKTGTVRLVIDPASVRAVQGERDPGRFGEIEIVSMYCTDEPALDERSWWGWNLRTTDDKAMLSLYDQPGVGSDAGGLAFALNNAAYNPEGYLRTQDADLYPEHLPFLQTPTFGEALMGEVSFKARKYAKGGPAARVTLYGAVEGVRSDAAWRKLADFDVEDDIYRNYSYKVPQGTRYRALRFAVTGVAGVRNYMEESEGVPPDPQRVLIDEVFVSERVEARVAFRNVAAFRTGLDTDYTITNATARVQAPMVGEAWGVQGEIYAAQLPAEVNLDDARVRLWWYEGEEPWGFENWRGQPSAHSAWLAIASDSNTVHRSGYVSAPAAVIEQVDRASTMQYMLEVVWMASDGVTECTNWLGEADWQPPAWYHPVDFNKKHQTGFSAFALLDTVAFGYAWINEVNMYDGPDPYGDTSLTNQYVEIAMPAEADLLNWRLNVVCGGLGDGDAFITNTIAVFGDDNVPSTKNSGGASNYVFLTVGNARSFSASTKAAATVDGAWRVRDWSSTQEQLYENGVIDGGYPIGLQLVRPSGVIEHQMVAAGTNVYADLPYYGEVFAATNYVRKLRDLDPRGRWFLAGEDVGEHPGNGLSTTNQFGAEGTWLSLAKTPGRINLGEWIDPDHPMPNGSSIVMYANLDGFLSQTAGGFEDQRQNVVLYLPKEGLTNGTEIVYRVDRWYELESVTEKVGARDVPHPECVGAGADGTPVKVKVAVNASNAVTVVAKTRVCEKLRKLGVDDGNAYKNAIMKWLSEGMTLRGPFLYPEGDIHLAEYHKKSDLSFVTNLTVTSMYWLDIDPTASNTWLVGDTSGFTPLTGKKTARLETYMMITNTAGAFEPYAPYTLRGVEPDSSSATYSGTWTSVTFKVVSSFLKPSAGSLVDWCPLKYWVFGEGSFQPRGHTDASGRPDEFTSKVEFDIPFYEPSPAYYAGWWKYQPDYEANRITPLFGTKLSSDLPPVGPTVLKAVDYAEE